MKLKILLALLYITSLNAVTITFKFTNPDKPHKQEECLFITRYFYQPTSFMGLGVERTCLNKQTFRFENNSEKTIEFEIDNVVTIQKQVHMGMGTYHSKALRKKIRITEDLNDATISINDEKVILVRNS